MSPFPSSSSPSPPPSRRRPKRWARKCERYCWTAVTYFPLAFVYGLTTWAVWVEVNLGLNSERGSSSGRLFSVVAIVLYLLLNWSYTTAVFTDPGSPLSSSKSGYSYLPTQEQELPSFTVKSTGGVRFCKKCQARKPDRAHHCSTCNRCVLKMDHHCPWLATCVGLRNYKPFLLFVLYTTLFCWVCFGTTSAWLWFDIIQDQQYLESFMPVNYVVLCVLAGIIGLALTGFGGWHVSLAWRGQTTIECLEKTRYLSPLRKTMQRKRFGHSNSQEHGQTYGQQLAEIHTNALPGITRPEEGEELPEYNGDIENGLLGPRSSRRIYNDMERERERERYEEYLDEQDSEKLPNAFDLGWKKNLTNLFGDRPLFWALPICNTMGDGWHWDVSLKWVNAREDVRKAREAQWREQEESVSQAGWVNTSHPGNGYKHQRHESDMHYVAETNGSVPASRFRSRSPNKIDYTSSSLANGHFNGHANPNGRPSGKMAPDTTRHKSSFDYDSDASGTGNNEENSAGTAGHWYGHQSRRPADDEWREWN